MLQGKDYVITWIYAVAAGIALGLLFDSPWVAFSTIVAHGAQPYVFNWAKKKLDGLL